MKKLLFLLVLPLSVLSQELTTQSLTQSLSCTLQKEGYRFQLAQDGLVTLHRDSTFTQRFFIHEASLELVRYENETFNTNRCD